MSVFKRSLCVVSLLTSSWVFAEDPIDYSCNDNGVVVTADGAPIFPGGTVTNSGNEIWIDTPAVSFHFERVPKDPVKAPSGWSIAGTFNQNGKPFGHFTVGSVFSLPFSFHGKPVAGQSPEIIGTMDMDGDVLVIHPAVPSGSTTNTIRFSSSGPNDVKIGDVVGLSVAVVGARGIPKGSVHVKRRVPVLIGMPGGKTLKQTANLTGGVWMTQSDRCATLTTEKMHFRTAPVLRRPTVTPPVVPSSPRSPDEPTLVETPY